MSVNLIRETSGLDYKSGNNLREKNMSLLKIIMFFKSMLHDFFSSFCECLKVISVLLMSRKIKYNCMQRDKNMLAHQPWP